MKFFNKTQSNSDTLNNGESTNLTLVGDGQKGSSRSKSGSKKSKQYSVAQQQNGNGATAKNDGFNNKTNNNSHGVGSVNKKSRKNNNPNAPRNEAAVENNAQRNPLRYEQPRGKLKIMFLGGVGEIGKNMTAFEYGNSIVILDAGMSFPGTDMPGVDVVIPDITYLYEHREKIKGILLTHGHEDHIGAMPFIVKKLGGKIDVYGTKLTLGLVENKLVEHSATEFVNFVPVSDKSIVTLGDFTAEFIHVSHSVAGSSAICLRTPVGTVFHTGDFKVDYTPLGNEIMNLNRIAEIGKQGVLLLMSESTNVEKPGYTMSR